MKAFCWLLVLTLLVFAPGPDRGLVIHTERIPDSGISIQVIRVPSQPPPRRPGIIIASGVLTRQGRLLPLAAALARNGFVVVTFDFSSPWRTELERIEETRRVIDWTARRPEIDPDRLGLLGHSMGGNVVYGASVGDPRIRSVVSLGMAIFADPRVSPPLFHGIGLYDQAHSPAEMRDAHAASGGTLVISPFSSHATELLDPALIRETTAWFRETVGSVETSLAVWQLWITWLWVPLRLLLAMFALSRCLVSLEHRLAGGLTLGLLFLPIADRPALLAALAAAFALAAAWRHRPDTRPVLVRGVGYLIATAAAAQGSHFLTRLPELLRHPPFLAAFPVFFLVEPLQSAYAFFESVGEGLRGWSLYGCFAGIVLLETARPGTVVTATRRRISPLVARLLAPLLPTRITPRPPSAVTLLLLATLGAAGIVLWRYLLVQYSLDADLWGKLGQFMLQSIFLPATLFWGIVRIPPIRRRLTAPGNQEAGTGTAAGY